ncbi:MAG: hypothetical protein KDB18_09055, partial [Salinibacterium sp.]|nr:hypothetical protein [Salinibacterium sp.]
YRREFNKLPSHLGVAPHTSRIAALWAVMTRLMEPAGTDLDDETRRIVETLTPLEKAKLYDGGEAPARLAPTDQNRLRAALPDIASEYDTLEMEFEGQWDAAYEGRRGCSPREMLTMISEIALDPPGDCVTPMLVLKRLPDLIKDPGLYQFLRIKRTRNGYHDCHGFIEAVRDDYLDLVRHDVERAAELVDEGEFRRLFDDYFKHVRAQQTNERVLNEKTGAHGAPDEKFMKRIEELLEAGSDAKAFRSEFLTKAASFRLSNPDQKMVHVEVFADLFHRMRENAFRQRLEGAKRIVEDSLVQLDVLPGSPDAERRADAELFLKRMTTELGYSEYSAREALEFFYRNINRFISP